MTVPEFEARLAAWAGTQPGLEALVQMGSRVQPGATVDAWSDWDYHLIADDPARFESGDWLARIAPCWSVHLDRTPRGVMKLSAVFAGGHEADFVLLPAWPMRLVYWAMARPGFAGLYPRALRQGIAQTRLWLRPGHRLVHGGFAWERRLQALAVTWPEAIFSASDFQFHVSGFWRQAVWVAKKIRRGEGRAALRGFHVELREHTYALLAEEARLAGRAPRPEGRKAEHWLDGRRREQTAVVTAPGQRELAAALRAELELFGEATATVARARGWLAPDHGAMEAWLRAELDEASR